MTYKHLLFGSLLLLFISCNSDTKNTATTETYSDVNVVGAMKNVMWKGELEGNIQLDTISNTKGLYGIGPESFLKGELLINDGKAYLSKVTSDSTMSVEKTFAVTAPFFVYANVTDWKEITLPETIKTIQDLEKFIDAKTTEFKRPFAYKLKGKVNKATIHIQNLPKGTKVSSPEEAHQGQTNYELENEAVTIIGFFSTAHKGIFTHHDSFVHMHLITDDERQMEHLDAVEIDEMLLYLPRK